METAADRNLARSPQWRWWVCGLLLFASAINYMDRQTLANAATRITKQFALSQEQYGDLETGFGWAFAVGSVVFGILADKYPVRIVYPIGLALWSMTGFATGMSQGYGGLLICRTLLGFFEGAHWPCAVKTTRLLLDAKDRSMGNSLLQSGTSIGAIITPLVMRAMLTNDPASWRLPFFVIGSTGVLWLICWFAFIKPNDLVSTGPVEKSAASLWSILATRRMVVIMAVICLINTGWQMLRAWLPKFLQEGRGYSESHALYFNSLFYVATDVGVIGAGALTIWLHRKKFTVTRARMMAFGICGILAAAVVFVPVLPKGPALLGVLLIVGAGALGVFPIYHAFTQDLSREHQGKVTGVASIAAWMFSPAQKIYGRVVDQTKSFDEGLVVAGLMPLAALIILWLFWKDEEKT